MKQKRRNRIWLLIAGLVVALGATLALTDVLPKNHNGPAKAATVNEILGKTNVIKPLASVDAGCPEVDANASQAGKQGDGITQAQFKSIPEEPSPTALTCAIARAKAAGWLTAGDDSAKCTIEKYVTIINTTSDPNDPTVSVDTKKTFRSFCMNAGPKQSPACVIAFVVIDQQGNYIANLDDPSAYINVPRSYIAHRGEFANC